MESLSLALHIIFLFSHKRRPMHFISCCVRIPLCTINWVFIQHEIQWGFLRTPISWHAVSFIFIFLAIKYWTASKCEVQRDEKIRGLSLEISDNFWNWILSHFDALMWSSQWAREGETSIDNHNNKMNTTDRETDRHSHTHP